MEHPIMEMLNKANSEQDLLEQLLGEVNTNELDKARTTAAKVLAIRDLRLSLIKVINEND